MVRLKTTLSAVEDIKTLDAILTASPVFLLLALSVAGCGRASSTHSSHLLLHQLKDKVDIPSMPLGQLSPTLISCCSGYSSLLGILAVTRVYSNAYRKRNHTPSHMRIKMDFWYCYF